ncbi:hypothetical protein [Brevibacillus brevis]|uniref:Large polyvalent protein associated domain-containing protein n=1 Tax=Brevibacillus brevis TaxID=1393 RepID=A0ABY9TE44_BREBE|nr:hypothetical protein [Brevibacillus brevis]WNC17939.1 hypothetical protein RGB73_30250 [Brevibacillus brevis]
MEKVSVKQITFARVEGRHIDLFKKTFSTWNDVETAINNAARTAPDTGGYDKCDFWIEWEDGNTYKGRFDMQRQHCFDRQPLADHVNVYLRFLAGEQKPSHMTAQQYEQFISEYQESAREFLQTYQIGSE